MSSAAALLLATAAVSALAQSPGNGSLAGKLTDLNSHPLERTIVILRNAHTGTETRTSTQKNGAYRFSNLAPGQYTLKAESAEFGTGQLQAIEISAGHEARVQAALELGRTPSSETPAAASNIQTPASPAPSPVPANATFIAATLAPPPAILRPPLELRPSLEKPLTLALVLEATIPADSLETFAVRSAAIPQTVSGRTLNAAPANSSRDTGQTFPPMHAPSSPQNQLVARAEPSSPVISNAGALAVPSLVSISVRPGEIPAPGNALAIVAIWAAQAALQLQQLMAAPALAASRAIDAGPSSSPPTLTGEQLQALPLAGRHWEDFVLDTPASATGPAEATDGQAERTEARSASISVDGASTRLAFGGRSGSRLRGSSLMGPFMNEAATSEVRGVEENGHLASDSGGSITTRSGTQRLHGQAFLFDRQNLWGAQNPFTQWVKETAPATLITTPVFTPLPYTAPDSEYTFGFGLGSRIRRQRLFWFAAFDGSMKNDPGVATVKHPDNFFAQPTNDEMQVLSARLGLSSVNPVAEGLAAYSGVLEKLSGLLGPASRHSDQSVAFGRLDWQPAERHTFTLEGTGSRWNSPGGGLTRPSETYGSHSFGASRASELWLLGRWEAFLTSNLLAVTQGSVGRHILAEEAEAPSPFEETLNVNAWGQLPQIVVDSRYGFTIGNPAQFGSGSYPDEHLYQLQEGLDWVHGTFLLKAGLDWRHNADATSMLRNHFGTYHYSSVANFASDALEFAAFGLSDALDPMNQHNCDQRGRAWRDSTGQLHGLGYLPCYSYYSQTLGPTDWHLSTNDLAGFAIAQWQPTRELVFSASLRWQRQVLPPPIALVNNPELPLTQKLPSPGNEWAPRASLAWGRGESHLPVFRLGYGMYFGRIQNSVLETALTQTGSLKGDLNFFMRPTDNLLSGGAPPFPYVLAGGPASVVKPGAVEMSPTFKNPEVHQGEASLEETLPGHVRITASAVASLGRRLPVTIDTNFDPTVNPGTITYGVIDGTGQGPIKSPQITVPFFASWPSDATTGSAGRLNPNYQQITEIMGRANSTYEAAMLRVSRSSRHGLSFNARYTYAHAMDWNPNESTQVSGSEVLDPTNFAQEYGTSNLDIRHSASGMLIFRAPWKLNHLAGQLANGWMLSGIGQFRSGLPYTMRTAGSIPEEFQTSGAAIVGLGPSMNGYGGDNRVYGVGRNTYRYPLTWKTDLRLGKSFNLGHTREMELLAESFNLFNHQNVTQLESVGYSITPGGSTGTLPTLNFLTGLKTGQTEFAKPLDINATDFFRPRQIDFGMRLRF